MRRQTTRKTLTTLALAGALLGASLSAHAEDSLATRVATGVGLVIAAQGNAALQTIRHEIRETLADTLPFLPKPEAQPEPRAVKTAGEPAGTETPADASI